MPKEIKISDILQDLPHLPGVYKMKDDQHQVIYVGKAKDLKKRVSSYFRKSKDKNLKTEKMVSRVADIDIIVVDSELEAIMLETNIIKELRPKYNILMKDDKNFAYIKVGQKEDFPRISITRQKIRDGSLYFGPKTSAFMAKETLKLLKKIFPYRHCPLDISISAKEDNGVHVSGNFKYPCIDFYIKRCLAPCIGKCSKEKYQNNIRQICDFLSGKTATAITVIRAAMMKAAAEKNFEAAAKIRDRLTLLEHISEQQKISSPDFTEMDVIDYVVNSKGVHVCVFQIRNGKVINQCNFSLKGDPEFLENADIMAAIIQDFYRKSDIPGKILLPVMPAEEEIVRAWLANECGNSVTLYIPQRGKNSELLALANKNVILYADRQINAFEDEKSGINTESALLNLAEKLNLPATPDRIECYDISHLSGTMTVGSMVVFKSGYPSKKDYRSFKLRTVKEGSIDDFKSLEEVLLRRLRYLSRKKIPGDMKIRKVTQSDKRKIAEITQNWRVPLLYEDKNEMMALIKENEVIGFVQLRAHDEKTLELAALWVNSQNRGRRLGYCLLRKALDATKLKKAYILTKNNLKDYYGEFGFIEINNSPDSLRKRLLQCSSATTDNVCVMLYDKNRFIIDSSFSQKPDLIVIDGGKGQLSAGCTALRKSDLNIPIISLAKKEEEVFIPGQSSSLHIEKDDQEGMLLQRIRNEAHRFAIELNRNQRSKRMIGSKLDEIKGLGLSTRKKLLKTFGSVENISVAPLADLKAVVGEKMALKLKAVL